MSANPLPLRLPPMPKVADLLRLYGLAAKKQLSQNFILDLNVTGKDTYKADMHTRSYMLMSLTGTKGCYITGWCYSILYQACLPSAGQLLSPKSPEGFRAYKLKIDCLID